MIHSQKHQACLWLVNLLRRHERLTLEQISQYWQLDTDLSGGNTLPRSTFNGYRNTIAQLFHIYIGCHMTDHTYYIEVSEEHDLVEWVLSSFSLASLTRNSEAVRQRILLDPAPQGMEYFDLVVQAMRQQCSLQATYQKFDAEPYDCLLRPYALKAYEGRWYLLCLKNDEAQPKVLALDRFRHIELLPTRPFQLPDDFDPQAYFQHSFGIYVRQGQPPTIRLRAHGRGRNYLRISPMHHTQRELPIDAQTSDFLLQCHTTPDLVLALLRHGSLIEVLEPLDLRQAVIREASLIAQSPVPIIK